jgi:hypothetical protein
MKSPGGSKLPPRPVRRVRWTEVVVAAALPAMAQTQEADWSQ